MLMEHRIDIRELSLVAGIIEDVLKVNNLTPLTKNMSSGGHPDKIQQSIEEHKKATTNIPVNSRVKERVEKIKNQDKTIKNAL